MKQVDNIKTNELLKGLGGDVEVENVDQYLQKQGVVVEVSVGRLRIPISLDPKIYGVNIDENEELNEFFTEHVKDSKLVFISKQSEKRLQSLETNVRQKLTSLAIGYNKKYLTIEGYKEFEKFFEEKKAEYLEIRDELVEFWDNTVKAFAVKLDKSLSQLNSLDRENIKIKIMKRIPTVEKYRDSFYMETRLKAFPVMANVDIFDNSIAEKVREVAVKENINSVYEILANILDNTFVTLSQVHKGYNKTGTLTTTQLQKMNGLIPLMKRNNLLKNELVDDIISDLEIISKETDIDSKMELVDVIFGKIYKYAQEINILNKLSLNKSTYSENELKALAEMI